MAFFTLKVVVGPLPPVPGGKELLLKRPATTVANRARPLQLRSEEEQKLQAARAFSISRRDSILCFTAAALGGVFLFPTEPVEARTAKSEIRRKIREKLEMLREKAGVSKPKTEDGENRNVPQPFAKDDKGASTFAPLLPQTPNPQRSLAVPLYLWWNQIFHRP